MGKLEEMLNSNQGFVSDFPGGILGDTGAGDLVNSGILNGMFEEAVTAYVTDETAYSFFFRAVTFPFPLLYGAYGWYSDCRN